MTATPPVHPPLDAFRQTYPFALDEYQLRACRALQEGRGVLVAAPTGSGKTVVGEFAVHLGLAAGRRVFYTTPIKALSNQKYADLCRRHGPGSVGLLTGDNTVNGDAPVVVMTTEVLRNMIYADSPALGSLGYVVMDEVHYLADRFRGAVWEEVIIHLPDDVILASLSATVSNAEEFGAWLDTVRGGTEVVVSEHRPVPLWQHVLVGHRLLDLFAEERINPDLRRVARERGRGSGLAEAAARRRGERPSRRGPAGPARSDVIATLDAAGLLPAITFIFSRAGCDAAVRQCLADGVRLTTPEEREVIRQVVDARCADIGDEDLAVLGYWEWAEALERGVAAHHAGLLPTFKEVVEDLFAQGLVKVVFATETLALGINMPARSVVLERLVKWNGETHAELTPGEYTQLTGRAGRRGIDVEGHAVVVWHPSLDPDAVGGLASTRTYPLRSSFRPTYNMAVNLVAQVGRTRAREVLETSFAQFQADRAVVGLARAARRQEEALAGYAAAMTCHLGDFGDYQGLRRQIAEREADLSRRGARQRRDEAIASLERLRRGDVVRIQAGRRPGYAVVIEPDAPGPDGPRPVVLTADRRVRRLGPLDVPGPLEPLARVPLPKGFSPRSPTSRRDLASSLRTALGAADLPPTAPKRPSAAATDAELAVLRKRLRAHSCHGCPEREDHARWAERWQRLRRETDTLLARIEGRTNTIARVFDRVCDLLAEGGYLDGDAVTARGQSLRRVYAESDLLVVECLLDGSWKGLDAPGLAACVSALVFQARGDERDTARVPGTVLRTALDRMDELWSDLGDREQRHRLDATPQPDRGLVWAVHRWASGARLESVLSAGEVSAGDFVRWCKQVVDMLGQVQQAAGGLGGEALVGVAAEAVERVRRGVVAHSSVG